MMMSRSREQLCIDSWILALLVFKWAEVYAGFGGSTVDYSQQVLFLPFANIWKS